MLTALYCLFYLKINTWKTYKIYTFKSEEKLKILSIHISASMHIYYILYVSPYCVSRIITVLIKVRSPLWREPYLVWLATIYFRRNPYSRYERLPPGVVVGKIACWAW